MALLPEDMGCAGTDPAGDMAVQRISERREKEKGTGIPEGILVLRNGHREAIALTLFHIGVDGEITRG